MGKETQDRMRTPIHENETQLTQIRQAHDVPVSTPVMVLSSYPW